MDDYLNAKLEIVDLNLRFNKGYHEWGNLIMLDWTFSKYEELTKEIEVSKSVKVKGKKKK